MSEVHPTDDFENSQPLAEDLRCASCGYNLRGLYPEMCCPECGTPIERSTRGDLLRYSDPAWVEKLARGTSLMRWGIIVSILLGIAGAGGVTVLTTSGLLTPTATVLVMAPVAIISQGLLLWAAVLVTTQEPRVSLEEDTVTARRLVRSCALLTFLGQFIQAITPATPGSNLSIALVAIGTVLTLAGIVGFFAQFVYFRRFALRIPDRRLADSTRTVMWGFVISYSVIILFGLLTVVSAWGGVGTSGAVSAAPGWAAAGGGLGVCAGSVAVLVFVCWAYRLLLKYNKAFRLAAMQARATAG